MNCGASVTGDGRFCSTCGKPVSMPAAASVPPPPPQATAAAAGQDLPQNIACLLCYSLWVLSGVLFLVLEPYNKNKEIRFHAWQSICLSGFSFLGWFAILILVSLLQIMPWIGWAVGVLLVNLFGLAVFVLWVVLMVKAYQGVRLTLPVISPLAEKQSGNQ